MASSALDRLKTRGSTEASLKFPSNLGSNDSKYYILFKIFKTGSSNDLKMSFSPGAGDSKGSYIARPYSEKPNDYIALYMPASITNVQNASYQSAELGILASVLKATEGGTSIDGFDMAKSITAASEIAIQSFKSGSSEQRSAANLAQISQGKVVNTRTELIFDNIDRRTFTFDFKMIPRTEDEAISIKKIVKKFRSNMSPNFDSTSGSNRTMIVPSAFEIEFKPNDGNYLPKIGRTVCTSCNVTYGGARPQFYEGGSPVETSMTLTFQELEMVTSTRIEEGGY